MKGCPVSFLWLRYPEDLYNELIPILQTPVFPTKYIIPL